MTLQQKGSDQALPSQVQIDPSLNTFFFSILVGNSAFFKFFSSSMTSIGLPYIKNFFVLFPVDGSAAGPVYLFSTVRSPFLLRYD